MPPHRIVDPTGVGDAYRGGLMKGLAAGADWETSARLGSVAATYALEHLGGQSHAYTWDEFSARYDEAFRARSRFAEAPRSRCTARSGCDVDSDRRTALLVALAVGLVWIAALSAAPLVAAQLAAIACGAGERSRRRRLSRRLGYICHQRPERSFHSAGVPLPVCARCTGLHWRRRSGSRA